MLNFMIVVDDSGELKTVTATEFEKELHTYGLSGLLANADHDTRAQFEDSVFVETVLNHILDRRAIADGSYDPSDNDTPIVVTMSAPA